MQSELGILHAAGIESRDLDVLDVFLFSGRLIKQAQQYNAACYRATGAMARDVNEILGSFTEEQRAEWREQATK